MIQTTTRQTSTPSQPAAPANILLDPFNRRWEEYRSRVVDCQAAFSVDGIHDLRVAARRLLAILEISAEFTSRRRVGELRRELKSHLDGFDSLRDVQVMLSGLPQPPDEMPGVGLFRDYLQKKEQRLLHAAEKLVAALNMDALNRRMLKLQGRLQALPGENMGKALLQAVDRAYQQVLARYSSIEPDRLSTIHSLRVAFKKFRYMLECALPALTAFPPGQFKRMQAYQTLMGEIQDAQVFAQNLEKYAVRHPDLELDELRHYAGLRLSGRLADFLERKAELATFWRTYPGAAFYWQYRSKEEAK